MTAAHCCEDQSASSVKIVAAEHNLEQNEGFEQVKTSFNQVILKS
jgi:hypothetical protein